MGRFLARLRRQPTTRTHPTGPALQRAEQEAARRRLLDQARRRQAEYRYDGPAR